MAKKPDLMTQEEIDEANRKALAETQAGNKTATDLAVSTGTDHQAVTAAAIETAREAGMDRDDIISGPNARRVTPATFSETQVPTTDQLHARIQMLEMEVQKLRAGKDRGNDHLQGSIQSLYALVRWLYDRHHRGADLAEIIRDHATDLAGSEILDRTVVRTIPVQTRGSNQPTGIRPDAQRLQQMLDGPMDLPEGTRKNLLGVS